MATTHQTTDGRGEATELTFEEGYDRMKALVERLESQDVPMSELFDSVAEVHGLGTALEGYLAEQQGKLERIEAGDTEGELPRFTITASSAPAAAHDATPARTDIPVDTSDYAASPARATAPAEDDIPF
jgi:exonuclease VII small subunit